jgi:hypothetical protein
MRASDEIIIPQHALPSKNTAVKTIFIALRLLDNRLPRQTQLYRLVLDFQSRHVIIVLGI